MIDRLNQNNEVLVLPVPVEIPLIQVPPATFCSLLEQPSLRVDCNYQKQNSIIHSWKNPTVDKYNRLGLNFIEVLFFVPNRNKS